MTKLETRLVRTDFSAFDSIFCKLFADGTEIGDLTSTEYNDEGNFLLVPKAQVVRIVVYDKDQVLGSVSFSVTLLTDSGCVWLPVFVDMGRDWIEELPEELSSPKILIYFEWKVDEIGNKGNKGEKGEIEDIEDIEDIGNEAERVKDELKTLTREYQDLMKNSKVREMALIKNLEEKEIEIQEYIGQLSRAQSRIFTLMAEKKHLNDNLMRVRQDGNYGLVKELRKELEISRQELYKCEKRNDALVQKLEDIHGEWNFIEEESKYCRETELINQVNQYKNELEMKTKEIELLKSQSSSVLTEVTNKSQKDLLNDTIKQTKNFKSKDSANTSVYLENLQNSIIVDDYSILQNSLYVNSSKATYTNFKENFRKTPEPERPRLPKGGTLNSSSKTRFLPVTTSRRVNYSAERRGK